MATESESSASPEQATLRRNAIGLPNTGAVYSGAIVSAKPGRPHLRRLVCAWPDCRCLAEHARTGEPGA